MPHSDLDLLLLIDDDVIAELRDILQEEFGDLVRDFVDDVPIQLELMQTALDQGNADGLYRLAHKLKSSCGSLGAPRLAELVRQLEQAGRQATLDGAATLPYEIANLRVEYAMANTAVPVGWWRSVYNSQHPVANECFLDEIAVAAGVDPLALRLGLLPAGSRLRGVLERVAAVSGWAGGAASAAGRARGLACHECFGSAAATVAEVSVDRSRVTVHRVWTAIDCGLAVHPDGVRAQCEGNVAMAVTALLHGEITIEGGRVQQTNFDSYPLLTMGGMPEVQVEILESGEPIGGVGEPGQPPVVPAVLNAVFAATGTRVRELPVRLR